MMPSTSLEEPLRRNLEEVRGRIRAACARVRRDPDEVRLVAVTKSVEAEVIRALVRLGVSDLGENRVQAAAPKVEPFQRDATWHLIGHLQGNKARRALGLFAWIHSVDSLALLDRIDRLAAELGQRPKVLLQLDLSGEGTKSGASAEELSALAARAASARALEAVGLMTMGPLSSDPEDSRPCFRRLRELRDDLRQNGLVAETFHHLSMGMTDDFEIAVEEGATLVRVGRALFRGLEQPDAGV